MQEPRNTTKSDSANQPRIALLEHKYQCNRHGHPAHQRPPGSVFPGGDPSALNLGRLGVELGGALDRSV